MCVRVRACASKWRVCSGLTLFVRACSDLVCVCVCVCVCVFVLTLAHARILFYAYTCVMGNVLGPMHREVAWKLTEVRHANVLAVHGLAHDEADGTMALVYARPPRPHASSLCALYPAHARHPAARSYELAVGGSLDAALTERGRVTDEMKMHLAANVTAGLAYLHTMSPPVVHGALTPAHGAPACRAPVHTGVIFAHPRACCCWFRWRRRISLQCSWTPRIRRN